MKILLPIDGSRFAQAALEEVLRRPWPPDSEVRILSVAHPIPLIPDPLLLGAAAHHETLEEENVRAAHDVVAAAEELASGQPHLRVTTAVLEGSPKKRIVEEAERWGADLIVIGSHGHGAVVRFLLGSVTHAVAHHAPCSVEIVRGPADEAPPA